ncbi:hypothetical protein [Dyella ginsengisoli]|uniref:hypothetical protein n=1 Tax=Dyella ginsengisoli TaxID=363848 RepID=UPI0012FDE612|nr:hypothetical protein [Dyella ginsengisoli]
MTKQGTAQGPAVHPSPGSEIELSTLFWHPGQLPETVALLDCALKLPLAEGGMHGLYGRTGRHEGFMAARERAVDTGSIYTVIDYRLQLSHKVEQKKRSAENMSEHEVLPVHALTADYAAELDTRIRSAHKWRTRSADERTASCLLETLAEHPSAVNDLLHMPELEHVRLFVYLAKPSFCQRPVPVATVPERHLGHIFRAESRLDPELVVTLPRAPKARSAPAHHHAAPAHTPKPR